MNPGAQAAVLLARLEQDVLACYCYFCGDEPTQTAAGVPVCDHHARGLGEVLSHNPSSRAMFRTRSKCAHNPLEPVLSRPL